MLLKRPMLMVSYYPTTSVPHWFALLLPHYDDIFLDIFERGSERCKRDLKPLLCTRQLLRSSNIRGKN